MTAPARWACHQVERGLVHVVPLGDLTTHDINGTCHCGPWVELVRNDDGPDGWLHVHNSLDGREASE